MFEYWVYEKDRLIHNGLMVYNIPLNVGSEFIYEDEKYVVKKKVMKEKTAKHLSDVWRLNVEKLKEK